MSEQGQDNHELKNGKKVVVRPLREDEFEASFRFFCELPEEDRLYLRIDVTDPEVVRRRMKPSPILNLFRIVALHEDRIVADATLLWPKHGWMSHVGEVRIIIAEDFQRLGLGSILYQKLFIQAVKQELQKIEAHMMPQQTGALKSVMKLGFKEEGRLPGFVKDIHGDLQDLIIMSANVGGF
jgi:RimJ/RimL family protein N-acetyltransferase